MFWKLVVGCQVKAPFSWNELELFQLNIPNNDIIIIFFRPCFFISNGSFKKTFPSTLKSWMLEFKNWWVRSLMSWTVYKLVIYMMIIWRKAILICLKFDFWNWSFKSEIPCNWLDLWPLKIVYSVVFQINVLLKPNFGGFGQNWLCYLAGHF